MLRSYGLALFFFQAQSGEGDHNDESSMNPTNAGDGSVRQSDGNLGASAAEATASVTRLASIESFDSKWYWLNTLFGPSLL